MAKKSIQYFPVVGWGMKLYGMIFLSRAWDKDQTKVEKSFQNIKDIEQPMYFVSFLEGTRITEKKLEETREFAQKRNITPPSKVLLPRVKGFLAILKSLRNSHVKYIVR
jgi:lysophosphatidic acid acyltransferase/lysophosphatidylinositol acyltransferase